MEDLVSGGKQNVVGAVPNTGIGYAALRLKRGARRQRKLLNGFKGTVEIRLAMKSSEVDSVITGWETLCVTN